MFADTGTIGVVTVPFVACASGTTWADVPVAGAYHQRVVTPTGKVYVACREEEELSEQHSYHEF